MPLGYLWQTTVGTFHCHRHCPHHCPCHRPRHYDGRGRGWGTQEIGGQGDAAIAATARLWTASSSLAPPLVTRIVTVQTSAILDAPIIIAIASPLLPPPPSATVDCCYSPCHPSSLLNPSSLGLWRSSSSSPLPAPLSSTIGWRGRWHWRRIALPPNNNNGDLPFLLFFFQTDRGSPFILQGTKPYFLHIWMTRKATRKTNKMGIWTWGYWN